MRATAVPVRIEPCSLALGREGAMLDEALQRAAQFPPETVLVFPEYLALTAEGAEQVLSKLRTSARHRHQAYITTLPWPGDRLPGGDPGVRYNTAVIVTALGEVEAIGGKVSPQSFETGPAGGRMAGPGVAPYDGLWRVPVVAGTTRFTVVMTVCSDALYLATGTEGLGPLAADLLLVPANFGRGAEEGARAVGRLALQAGWFREAVFVNPGQPVRPGRLPLTRSMADHWVGAGDGEFLAPERVWEGRMRIVRDHLVLVPDHAVSDFVTMANWTDTPEGRIMMPASRASMVPSLRDWPRSPVVAF